MTRRAVALVGSWLGLSLLPLSIIFEGRHAAPLAVTVSDGLGYIGLVMLGWQFILNARTRTLDELFGAKAVHGLHRYGTCLALALLAAHPAILFVLDPHRYLRLLDLMIAPWRARAAVASAALLALLVLLSWKRLRGKFSPKLWRSLHRTAGVIVVTLGLAHIVLVGHYTTGWEGAALVTVVLGATLLPMTWVREPSKKPSRKPAALVPRLYFGFGLHRVRQPLALALICAAASLLLVGRVMPSAARATALSAAQRPSMHHAAHVGRTASTPGGSPPPGASDGAPPTPQTGQAVSVSPMLPSADQSATSVSSAASTPAPVRPPTPTPTPQPRTTPTPAPTATPSPQT